VLEIFHALVLNDSGAPLGTQRSVSATR
jgi:hypothetical protein